MVDPAQQRVERLLDPGQVRERQRRLVELAVGDAGRDDPVDERLQPPRRRLVQAPRGGLDRVGEHDDGLLVGLRARAGVPVVRLVHDRRVLLGLLGLPVEELDQARPVVARDKVDDDLGQVLLAPQLDALLDVGRDHERAHRRLDLLVRVLARLLVLDEVLGLEHLPDVVVERPDARPERVRADGVGRGLGQVGHLERVVERARRLHRELLEQRPVGVRELQQRHVGRHAEHPLHPPQDRRREQDQRRVDGDGHDVGPGTWSENGSARSSSCPIRTST